MDYHGSILTDTEARAVASAVGPVQAIAGRVIAEVAQSAGLRVSDITGKSRRRPVVQARHMAIAIVHRRRPEWSLARIGAAFGGLDHTSVANAIRRGQALLEAGE